MAKLSAAFNRLWSASIASNLADGVLRTAGPLVAVHFTESPVLISLISALTMLPWLLFAIPIGAMADRVDRRKLLATANIIRGFTAAATAVTISLHQMNIGWLFLVIAIFGTCEVITDTAAQTLIPSMLQKDELEQGNSRLYFAESIVQGFIGSPIGGLIYALAIALPFYVTSAGYFVAALMIASIPFQSFKANEKPSQRQSLIADIKFGLNYLYKHKDMRHLVIFTTAVGVIFNFSGATMILFILKTLHLKSSLFGVVMAIEGIGALLGSVYAAKLSQKFGRGKVMGHAMFWHCLLFGISGFFTNIIPFVIVGVVINFLITMWNILIMATYQELIPNHLYGRIHGARRTFVWGMMPVGSLLGGLASNAFGLRMPIITGAALATILTFLNLAFFDRLTKNSANATTS